MSMSRTIGVLSSLLLAGLALPAFAEDVAAPVGSSAQRDSEAIREVARRFSAAYVRGDAAAMAELYTPDGVIFPDRSPALVGREAIRKFFTPRPGQQITRHQITPTRITITGDVAHDYGTFEISGTSDGKPWGPYRGKYVVVWRRDAKGAWRMYLDIWNSLASSTD